MLHRVPAGDNLARPVCRKCEYVHYINPKILVACVLFHENKILWIRRANNPFAGLWAIPAGFMEAGERAEQTACRELYEETRLVLAPDRLAVYAVTSLPAINQVYISLIAPLPSMNFHRTAESTDIKLATEKQMAAMNVAYPPGAKRRLRSLYARVRSGEAMTAPAILTHVRSTPLYRSVAAQHKKTGSSCRSQR
jgi:ADP-ribose pyrophosphatase YjhB (NUDIX family)